MARKIVRAVDALRDDPRPSGARLLVGYSNLMFFIVWEYCVIYTIRDAELLVLALRIAHRAGRTAASDNGWPARYLDRGVLVDEREGSRPLLPRWPGHLKSLGVLRTR